MYGVTFKLPSSIPPQLKNIHFEDKPPSDAYPGRPCSSHMFECPHLHNGDSIGPRQALTLKETKTNPTKARIGKELIDPCEGIALDSNQIKQLCEAIGQFCNCLDPNGDSRRSLPSNTTSVDDNSTISKAEEPIEFQEICLDINLDTVNLINLCNQLETNKSLSEREVRQSAEPEQCVLVEDWNIGNLEMSLDKTGSVHVVNNNVGRFSPWMSGRCDKAFNVHGYDCTLTECPSFLVFDAGDCIKPNAVSVVYTYHKDNAVAMKVMFALVKKMMRNTEGLDVKTAWEQPPKLAWDGIMTFWQFFEVSRYQNDSTTTVALGKSLKQVLLTHQDNVELTWEITICLEKLPRRNALVTDFEMTTIPWSQVSLWRKCDTVTEADVKDWMSTSKQRFSSGATSQYKQCMAYSNVNGIVEIIYIIWFCCFDWQVRL